MAYAYGRNAAPGLLIGGIFMATRKNRKGTNQVVVNRKHWRLGERVV